MNPMKQIEELTRAAEAHGFQIRHEYFGGTGGGICEFGGKKILFVDLALNTQEQLDRLRLVMGEEGLLSSNLQKATDQSIATAMAANRPSEPARVGFRSQRRAA